MNTPRKESALLSAVLLCCLAVPASTQNGNQKNPAAVRAQGPGISSAAQAKALQAISAEDMKPYLRFLGARELRGRSAPSVELDIAAKYLAVEAARIGLKPLMPDGSYLQHVPVEVTTVSPVRSHMRINGPGGEQILRFPQGFTPGRPSRDWAAAGGIVFAGAVLNSQQPAWDEPDIDLSGRFVLFIQTRQPGSGSGGAGVTTVPAAVTRAIQSKGAAGILVVIDKDREAGLAKNALNFDVMESLRFLDVETATPSPPVPPGAAPRPQPTPAPSPFYSLQIRREAGAAILGVSGDELDRLADSIAKNERVPAKALAGKTVSIVISLDQKRVTTPNVVAVMPGTDPILKEEYVVISSHHDHNPPREGLIYPGADDNASGCVAMLSIAKAMMVERPKRSVIFLWNTAEERGLIGAYYFVQHAPVPPEKISACLNLDMVTRNDPNSIYLIGSNKVSSELDNSFREQNQASVKLNLDYKYESPSHPENFFFRSDQYPFIRYGIPGVWIFCGTTEDYHREGDVEEKADYGKMEKVTKLTYLVAMDIGNKPELLKLDLHPEIRTRGRHNMKVVWRSR